MTDASKHKPRAGRAAKTPAGQPPGRKKPERVYRSIAEVRRTFYPAENPAEAPWDSPRRHTAAVFGPDAKTGGE